MGLEKREGGDVKWRKVWHEREGRVKQLSPTYLNSRQFFSEPLPEGVPGVGVLSCRGHNHPWHTSPHTLSLSPSLSPSLPPSLPLSLSLSLPHCLPLSLSL